MKTFKDTDLREALRRKYADVPQMPLNLGERIMKEAPLNKPNKVKRKAVRKSNFAMPAPTDADRTLAETEPAPAEERPAHAHLSPEQEVLLAMEAREQDFRSRGKRLQREIEEMMRN